MRMFFCCIFHLKEFRRDRFLFCLMGAWRDLIRGLAFEAGRALVFSGADWPQGFGASTKAPIDSCQLRLDLCELSRTDLHSQIRHCLGLNTTLSLCQQEVDFLRDGAHFWPVVIFVLGVLTGALLVFLWGRWVACKIFPGETVVQATTISSASVNKLLEKTGWPDGGSSGDSSGGEEVARARMRARALRG